MLKVQFHCPAQYGLRLASLACWSATNTCLHRTLQGARLPGWNWTVEIGTGILRAHLLTAFKLPSVNEARRYMDSVVLNSPALSDVSITPVTGETIRGSWFVPKKAEPKLTVLYFHGGGYSFYPKAHANLSALITLAAQSRTFVLDYRLAPEYRFPSQLEDAHSAYRWLLDNGTNPNELVVGGDSAGGNLAIAFLLLARDLKLPLPKLVFALSPPTDFEAPMESEGSCTSLVSNEAFDWIAGTMLVQWADWFCPSNQRRDPYVSPAYADLRNISPIYIQAGRAEVLYDSIAAFATGAKRQGANVVLESWADMNHDFQVFGYEAPQSTEALRRLGEVIDQHVREPKPTPTL
jgi:acetyl esterase/lipase